MGINRLNIILFLICFIFCGSLMAESYSSYRLDDALLLSTGIRKESLGNRFSNTYPNDLQSSLQYDITDDNLSGIRQDASSQWGWNFFTNGNYRTQKGGRDSNRTSYYNSELFVSPEIYSKLSIKKWQLYYVGSITSSYSEFRQTEIQKTSIVDAESILGIQYEDVFLQAGRGFFRADRYGFLFNSIMNFSELGYKFSINDSYFEIRGITGNINQEEENLTPNVWKSNRKEIQGGFLRGSIKDWGLDWNLYLMSMSSSSRFPTLIEEFRPGESYRYYSAELGYKIIKNLQLDLGGISWIGFKDRYIPGLNQENPKIYKNGILYYLNLEYDLIGSRIGGSGILEIGDNFSPIQSQRRFMGGEGSILLTLRDDPLFLPLDFSKNTNLEGGGLYWSYKWLMNKSITITTKINLNSVSSYYGFGREGIIGWGLEFRSQGFIMVSLAHARIDPKVTQGFIIDENRIPLDRESYEKIYLTGGLVF